MKRKIVPGEIPVKDLHQFMIGSIAPRPIAFVSTVDENMVENLAPYSFFNAFSSNPPILVFSSNRRVSNNTTKDTLRNIRLNSELVVNVVNHSIVRQMSIASAEYDSSVSEFEKSGLTRQPSLLVKPSAVMESPVNMECRVKEIITLGEQGGAGHLIICDVLVMHIDEAVLDGDRIDPHKIDLMGRMGRTFYVRASGAAVSSIYQPVTDLPVGFDALPDFFLKNKFLSGNEISYFAGLNSLPEKSSYPELSEELLDLDEESFIKGIRDMLFEGKTEQAYLLMCKFYQP